jgi:hypothetical protein
MIVYKKLKINVKLWQPFKEQQRQKTSAVQRVTILSLVWVVLTAKAKMADFSRTKTTTMTIDAR